VTAVTAVTAVTLPVDVEVGLRDRLRLEVEAAQNSLPTHGIGPVVDPVSVLSPVSVAPDDPLLDDSPRRRGRARAGIVSGGRIVPRTGEHSQR